MARYATTFSELVDLTATNDPQATILGWWRRVDRALDDYYTQRGKARPRHVANVERDLAADPNVGEEGVKLFRELRLRRNAVTHENIESPSREEAVTFAQNAHRLGWVLGAGLKFSDTAVLPIGEPPSNHAFESGPPSAAAQRER
jgi:hypothetical protein